MHQQRVLKSIITFDAEADMKTHVSVLTFSTSDHTSQQSTFLIGNQQPSHLSLTRSVWKRKVYVQAALLCYKIKVEKAAAWLEEIRRMHLLWAITASYPFGLHRTHSVLHLITLAKPTKINTEQSLLYPLAVSATVYREMFSFCFMIFFHKDWKTSEEFVLSWSWKESLWWIKASLVAP